MSKAASVAQVRKLYGQAKRNYQSAGKKAMGKPKNSLAQKSYRSAKREYHVIGKELGKLTKLKPRKR